MVKIFQNIKYIPNIIKFNSAIKYYSYTIEDTPIDVTISKIDDQIIDFDQAFINFKIKDCAIILNRYL